MASDQERLPHIRVEGFYEVEGYTSPLSGGGSKKLVERDREEHGNRMLGFVRDLKSEFDSRQLIEVPEGVEIDPVVYVEFESKPGFKLAFDSLQNERGFHSLLITQRIKADASDGNLIVDKAIVVMKESGINAFQKKTEDFLDSEKDNKRKDKKTDEIITSPKNNSLLANIEEMQPASLEAFWTEGDRVPFPDADEVHWWEIWTLKNQSKNTLDQIHRVETQMKRAQLAVSDRVLEFAEHIVYLAKGTVKQLKESVFFLDCLAELRKPRETAEFFMDLNSVERAEWSQDLYNRLEIGANDESVAVCLLDTGVNNRHLLLQDFLPDSQMDSINPAWGNSDGSQWGHGTGMAGLALYGDLVDALDSSASIPVLHQLESVKVINEYSPNDPDLYGHITIEAVNRAIIMAPWRKRVFCMAITLNDNLQSGGPSSYSSALDKITFGEGNEDKALLFVSAGNVQIVNSADYPNENVISPVQDPAQSFNAVTVGSISRKDNISESQYSSLNVLAKRHCLSPYSRTSISYDSQWPIKPEVVFEGGNMADENGMAIDPDSLMLLTTDKDPRNQIFTTFNGTSASTALASRLAAQIMTEYPDLWPETVRGLVIHSAVWNKNMTEGRHIQDFSASEKRGLLRSYGYGVPNYQRAIHSLQSSVTMFVEETLVPFKWEENRDKTNEMHFFELPWPKEALANLFEKEVRLRVTLSYFIEPNPGNRRYSNKFFYQSHGLRFRLCRPDEAREEFRKRINKEAREEEENLSSSGSENWVLGSSRRDKGSIHSDWWIGTAADLAEKNLLAVYPVNGWYRKRKKLNKIDSEVRYSLIVTIEAPGVEVDLYTPVINQVDIPIET